MLHRTTLQTIGLLLGLAVIVASGPFLWSLGTTTADAGEAGLPLGEQLPAISAEGWLNGSALTRDDLNGKVVVINAWFLTCGYCHKGMPKLVELQRRFADRDDVVFVGLTFHDKERADLVEKFVKKYEVTWPNAYGAQETLDQFQAQYYPGYWVFGRDGRVVWNKSLGGVEEMGAAIEKALGDSAS